jgi:hypothetical protein
MAMNDGREKPSGKLRTSRAVLQERFNAPWVPRRARVF